MESIVPLSVPVTIEALNIFLHGIGIYLLAIVHKRGKSDPQNLYLINLAATEFLWNVFAITKDTIGIYKCFNTVTYQCINIALATGIVYNVVSAMLYFTGDRLLHIVLHARYEAYWSVKKTCILLSCTWTCNIVISAVFSLSLYFRRESFMYYAHIVIIYVPMFLYVIYMIFALTAYTIMFAIYVRSEKRRKVRRRPSVYRIYVESRFFIAVILIASYLILTVLPSVVKTVWTIVSEGNTPMWFVSICLISTRLSHSFDAVVYIFLQKKVRNVWKRRLCCNLYDHGWLIVRYDDNGSSASGSIRRESHLVVTTV